jgi:hypothetical protein
MKPMLSALVLTLLLQGEARSQCGPAPFSAAPVESVSLQTESDGCDSDFDGAWIGAGLGAAGGLGLAALIHDGCSEGLCAVGALVGSIAGFWAGLGLDSRSCRQPSSSSSTELGQSSLSNRLRARSASTRPSVWQVGQ